MGSNIKIGGEMPKIPYRTKKFDRSVLAVAISRNMDVATGQGEEAFTWADVIRHAMTAGDSSFIGLLGSRRPAIQLLWRSSVVCDALEDKADYFVKSASYEWLDPSEKTLVGYLLGMVQASMMAERVLGAKVVAHADVLLRILGSAPPGVSRPDLIGYSYSHNLLRRHFANRNSPPLARFLIEAKGSSRPYDGAKIKAAKAQLKSAPHDLLNLLGGNYIEVASLAYFQAKNHYSATRLKGPVVWRSHLEDPPSDGRILVDYSDAEFGGMVLLASLLPVYQALMDMERNWSDAALGTGGHFEFFRILIDGLVVGMPRYCLRPLMMAEELKRNEDKARDNAAEMWDSYLNFRSLRNDRQWIELVGGFGEHWPESEWERSEHSSGLVILRRRGILD